MKIDKLIKKLQALRKEHGNVEVTRFNWQDHGMPEAVSTVKIETVKHHISDVYYISKYLKTAGYGGGPAFKEPYQSEISARPDVTVVYIT